MVVLDQHFHLKRVHPWQRPFYPVLFRLHQFQLHHLHLHHRLFLLVHRITLALNYPMLISFIRRLFLSMSSAQNRLDNCSSLSPLVRTNKVCIDRKTSIELVFFLLPLVTVKDILRVFIQIMLGDHTGSKHCYYHFAFPLIRSILVESPSHLCCHSLKRIALEPNTCAPLMCNDELFEILLKPLRQFLSSKKMFNDYLRSNNASISERNLIRLAELFSAMTSIDVGYQYFIRSSSAANSYVDAAYRLFVSLWLI